MEEKNLKIKNIKQKSRLSIKKKTKLKSTDAKKPDIYIFIIGTQAAGLGLQDS